MNNGNRRRNRKRYKLRYDRIIAVLLVLIVLIVIITSCSKGCSKDDKNETSKDSQSSVVDELTSGSEGETTPAVGDTAADSTDAATQAASTEYTTVSVEYTQVGMGDLILVNQLHPYAFTEGDVTLATVYGSRNGFYSVKDEVLQLDSNVITQLNALMEAYATAASNTDLRIITGYRTSEEQADKYNSGKSVFPGGYSDYHTGRSFDIGIFPQDSDSYYYSPDYSDTVNYGWFDENAASYGFILRFPEGKDSLTGDSSSTYTYRYVGIPHAVYMKQNDLCLEEYIEQIKSYTSTSPLSVTSGTSQYEVYYVPANANAATDVPVPSNKTYTISGNNVDGFIVTVTDP